jgi:hypothetical protein
VDFYVFDVCRFKDVRLVSIGAFPTGLQFASSRRPTPSLNVRKGDFVGPPLPPAVDHRETDACFIVKD